MSTYYFLTDRLSVRLVLNASGNLTGRQGHLPFGEDFGETGVQEKHHFTSYERGDESYSDYAINRTFSPVVGRFMTPDPIVAILKQGARVCMSGEQYLLRLLGFPQELNAYAYQTNDAINGLDPTGLAPKFFKCLAQCLTSPGTGVGIVGGTLCGWACKMGNAEICAVCVGVTIALVFFCSELCAHEMVRDKGRPPILT